MSLVRYIPKASEPDPTTNPYIACSAADVILPSKRDTDPYLWAMKSLNDGVAITHVLVPGRAFDIHGTRHGTGGGWFDRYLSAAPREWIRVGVLFQEQLSPTPLTRQAWDQPMDLLLIKTKDGWSRHDTVAHVS